MTFDDYRYLWEGTSGGWCLLDLEPDEKDPSERYLIYNESEKDALIIEDDALCRKVVAMLLKTGAKILLPSDIAE